MAGRSERERRRTRDPSGSRSWPPWIVVGTGAGLAVLARTQESWPLAAVAAGAVVAGIAALGATALAGGAAAGSSRWGVGRPPTRLRRLCRRLRVRYRTWRRCGHAYAAAIDPARVRRVDPGAITHVLPPDRRRTLAPDDESIPIQSVEGGDWDLAAQPFVETAFYRSFRDRSSDSTTRGAASGRGARAGPARGQRSHRPPAKAAVLVNVGRDGRLILHEGRFRLAVARLLDRDSIAVHVLVRHERWQARRDRLALTGADDGDHPDLEGLGP